VASTAMPIFSSCFLSVVMLTLSVVMEQVHRSTGSSTGHADGWPGGHASRWSTWGELVLEPHNPL
jgi:hypothetical protein